MRKAALLLVLVAACGVESRGRDGGGGGNDLSAGGGDGSTGGCQGLACFQKDCGNGVTTTVTGKVTAPNGVDPVFDALVYVPKSLVEFPPTVQCEVCSEPIGGTPIVTTNTKVDGTFTLTNVPATSGVPLVIQKGRFRRTIMLNVNACMDNPVTVEQVRLPRNQQEGDLPKIAVAVGDYDQIECVLHSIGIDQKEFTAPSGSGAVHLYGNSSNLPKDDVHQLLLNPAKLATYNVVFIGCATPAWSQKSDQATMRTNLFNYVNTGGRLYATDYSYDYMEQVPQFSPYVYFEGGGDMTNPQPAGAAESYWGGQPFMATIGDPTLAQWLKLVGKTTGNQVQIEEAFSLAKSVNADQKAYPSTTWVHSKVPGASDPNTDRPHTVTFDFNMCGKVLWSSYHTRGPGGASAFGQPFPAYCKSNPQNPDTMIAQEKILEFLIFQISSCVNMIG